MPSIEEKITRYLVNLPPSVLGLGNKGSIKILEMAPGSYNLNFHVRVGPKDFIFRVNIEPQSGLAAQIEHEFNVLKFVDGHGIAPRAYHYDDSRRYFDFDILIEEYLAGPAQLYNSRKVLNSEESEGFIAAYAGLSGKNPDLLMEKVNIREPMISLHWILWAATKLANLSDQRTSPELVKAHEEKIARYERVANPENIERLVERGSLG